MPQPSDPEQITVGDSCVSYDSLAEVSFPDLEHDIYIDSGIQTTERFIDTFVAAGLLRNECRVIRTKSEEGAYWIMLQQPAPVQGEPHQQRRRLTISHVAPRGRVFDCIVDMNEQLAWGVESRQTSVQPKTHDSPPQIVASNVCQVSFKYGIRYLQHFEQYIPWAVENTSGDPAELLDLLNVFSDASQIGFNSIVPAANLISGSVQIAL